MIDIQITVTCDICKDGTFTTPSRTAKSWDEARREMRKRGWSAGQVTRKDRCPACKGKGY